MQRMHSWSKMACRLVLKTIYALHDAEVSELKGLKSIIPCLILKTFKTCSASKNLALKCSTLVYVSVSSILIYCILWPKVLYMHKYLIDIHYILQDASRDAIILKEKIQYLDPVEICESLHARPSWYKNNDKILKPYKTHKIK